MSVPHTKGGESFWTCVKNNVTKGGKQYDAIGISGFDYKLFEKSRVGVFKRD